MVVRGERGLMMMEYIIILTAIVVVIVMAASRVVPRCMRTYMQASGHLIETSAPEWAGEEP